MALATHEQFSTILQYAAQALDVPPELDRELTEAYSRLGKWIREDNKNRYSTDSEIYPHGSRRLGTLVRPVNPLDDYDIDLVYRRDLPRTSISQADLKAQTGEQLRRYILHLGCIGKEPPSLTEGRRCWTLQYDNRYHMDVLPALPDALFGSEVSRKHTDRIIITDKELRLWQVSNPRGYAKWFESRMAAALLEARLLAAKAASVDIEDVPEGTVKTVLQLIIQLLKRHRDVCYEGDPDNKPISIIITTLAALAYDNEDDLYAGLMAVTSGMRDLVDVRDGEWWVANPVDDTENFADKWRQCPERADCFFAWLERVKSDIHSALEQRGIHKVACALGKSLGSSAVTEAVYQFGSSAAASRGEGVLRASPITATLGSCGALSVPQHTFFGDVH